MKKIHLAILGAGNVATGLACELAKKGHSVNLYCIEPDVLKQINKTHFNDKYLAGIRLPKTIRAFADLQECLKTAKIIFVAVPSHVAVEVIKQAKPFMPKNAVVACITKGLDPKTYEPTVIAIQKALPREQKSTLCMIGGPAMATELAKGSTTAFVVACKQATARSLVANLLRGGNVKAAESADLMGVGLASALKNVYAISLGFCDGLQYPANTKALIVTLAVSEMAGIMLRAGADQKTAPSLAGLGDLLVTGLSPYGHNRKYGERLIRAHTNDPSRLGLTTVEGIRTSETALRLAKKLKARTPLLIAIHKGIHAKSNFQKPFENFLKNLKLGII